MSDTNPAGAGDFRGSAADKRKDETVMVNADDLSNLVSSARQDPAAAPPAAPVVPAPVAPVAAAPAGSTNTALIIGAAVVIVLVLVAIIAFVAFG